MKSRIAFWVSFGISIALIVGGFFCPPQGVIDPSVLTAVGELFLFGALFELPSIIGSGSITMRKGDAEITIDPEKEDDITQ